MVGLNYGKYLILVPLSIYCATVLEKILAQQIFRTHGARKIELNIIRRTMLMHLRILYKLYFNIIYFRI